MSQWVRHARTIPDARRIQPRPKASTWGGCDPPDAYKYRLIGNGERRSVAMLWALTPPTSRTPRRCSVSWGRTRACTLLRCTRGSISVAAGRHRAWRPTPTRSACASCPWGREGSCGAAWPVVHSIRGITALRGLMGIIRRTDRLSELAPQLTVRHPSLRAATKESFS